MEDSNNITERAKKLAGQITDYVNVFDRDREKEFAKALFREHRTLQQNSIRMMLETIELAATDDFRTDDRNKASQKTAERLMRGFVKVLAEDLKAEGQNVTERDIISNWDIYKPSKWLNFI